MKQFLFISVFCSPLVYGSVVSNVRLVDPIPYMINIITETVHRIEDIGWYSLKIPDHTMDLNEVVFGKDVKGEVSFKEGFVVRVDWLNILQSSLNQVWRYNSAANTTTVEITGTLRMVDVTIGLDVELRMGGTVQHYTVEYVQPLVSFDVRVVRDMFTEVVDVTVTPIINPQRNGMDFMPSNDLTDAIAVLYDYTAVTRAASIWASDYIRPFALNAVENVFDYPEICYNCPVQ